MTRGIALAGALALAGCADDGGPMAGTGESTTTGTSAVATSLAGSAATSSSEGGSSTLVDPDTSGGSSSSESGTNGDGMGLELDGDGFTFDGAPIFLLGVSYFDGRDWQVADLDGLSARGWNLVRVWLDWSDDGFFDGDAFLSEDGSASLLELVAAARERDMIVDVTILDPELAFSPDTEHRVRASQSVAMALADADNVLFDVMNEHDHPGGPIDHAEAATIVAGVRAVDPDRIVTISSTGGHLVADDAAVQAAAVDEELDVVGIDVITPHLPRTPWASVTGARVASLRAHLRGRGIAMPIYLQEEARRGHSGLDPSAEAFVTAAQQAQGAGAAGWIFHTDAAFELGPAGFFAALDEVETVVIDTLPGAL